MSDEIIMAVPEEALTEFERAAKSGADMSKYERLYAVKPGEVKNDQIAQTLKNLESKAVRKVMDTQGAKIPDPTDFSKLSKEKQAQVLQFLQSAETEVPQSNTVIPTTTTAPSIPLPKFATAPAPEPERQAPQQATNSNDHTCVNCGWDNRNSIGEISIEDRRAWMRSVLGNQPFSKTYKLFNGQIEIKLRTRSLKCQDLIHRQLVTESADGRIPERPPQVSLAVHNLRMRQLNLAASMVWITGASNPFPDITSQDALAMYKDGINEKNNVVAAAYDAIFGEWSEALFNSVMKVMAEFDVLCFRLMDASVNSDFWPGTAG